MNHDDRKYTAIDRQLSDAGARLRDAAPDEVASQQALHQMRSRPAPAATPARSWWPALAGLGLASTAVIGVVAFNALDSDDATVRTPAATDPAPITEPTTAPDASAPPMTTLPVLAPTGTDDPSTTTAPSDDGTVPMTTVPPEAVSPCVGLTTPPQGFDHVVVGCRSNGGAPVGLISEVPSVGQPQGPARWFTTPSAFAPDGAELGPAREVAGLPGVLGFAPQVDLGNLSVDCVVLVQPMVDGEWREYCWTSPDGTPTNRRLFTDWDGQFVQLDIADPERVVAHPLDSVWKSSGCSFGDAEALLDEALAVGSAGALFTGLGCDAERGAVSAGSVFMQPGGPDGLVYVAERIDEATWTLIDLGTEPTPAPRWSVSAFEDWTQWPGDTNPRPSTIPIEEINALPTFRSGLADSDAVATAMVEYLVDRRDPEFAGLPIEVVHVDSTLVVINSTEGGDDSVGGTVHFVHVDGGENGFVVTGWYYSAVCSRGGGPELCV